MNGESQEHGKEKMPTKRGTEEGNHKRIATLSGEKVQGILQRNHSENKTDMIITNEMTAKKWHQEESAMGRTAQKRIEERLAIEAWVKRDGEEKTAGKQLPRKYVDEKALTKQEQDK